MLESGRPGPKRRRLPAVLWALTGLHVGLLLVFSLLYPPFSGFDETQHIDAALSIRHGDGWPAPQERQLSEGIVEVAGPLIGGLSRLPFSDDPVPPRDERPSFASLGVERDSVGQVLPNQITQHPPLYYALGAAVLAVLPGSSDWAYDRTVGVLRLLSIALMAPLPLLAWATARALRAGRRAGLVAAALSLSVPQLQRVGGSVNNDALFTLAFAAAVVLLVRVALGDLRRRTVLLTGLVVGLALLAKGFALVLPLAVPLAFLVAGVRARSRAVWRPGLLCLVVAFVVGGWWWLRNLVLYGTVQPSGWPDTYRDVLGMVPRSPGTPAPVGPFLEEAFLTLSERFWGGLEINYVGPDTFPHAFTTLLVVLAAAALAVAVGAAGRARPALVVGVLVPFVGVLGLVGYGMWAGYLYSLDLPGAQGRYLFGSLPSLSAGVALGLVAAAGRARRGLLPLVVLFALGMQAYGLRSVMLRSWLPPYEGRSRLDRYAEALGSVVDWSPWPTAVTLAAFAGTALAGAAVLVLAVREAVVAPAEPAPDGPAGAGPARSPDPTALTSAA